MGLPTRPRTEFRKTTALNNDDCQEFVELQGMLVESERSWLVDVAEIDR
ncbi:hypothetical protein PN462_16395 [Spirulina sp. CS-785/01]|nr:hypothetical protein [Spirulina sp. CS-785/01]MDB9314694.1 hypothetical protein [Spirulina sp. CS-785/01]